MADRTVVLVLTESASLERMTVGLLETVGITAGLPAADETTLQALQRTRPQLIMLDCEHPVAVSDRFFEVADRSGIRVLVYGREPREADVEILARQQNLCKLILPVDAPRMALAVTGAMTS